MKRSDVKIGMRFWSTVATGEPEDYAVFAIGEDEVVILNFRDFIEKAQTCKFSDMHLTKDEALKSLKKKDERKSKYEKAY